MVFAKCDSCNGKGYVGSKTCPRCHGLGKVDTILKVVPGKPKKRKER